MSPNRQLLALAPIWRILVEAVDANGAGQADDSTHGLWRVQ